MPLCPAFLICNRTIICVNVTLDTSLIVSLKQSPKSEINE
jgi:hypothetical protein